jgi:PAS domain S-box-containing protein
VLKFQLFFDNRALNSYKITSSAMTTEQFDWKIYSFPHGQCMPPDARCTPELMDELAVTAAKLSDEEVAVHNTYFGDVPALVLIIREGDTLWMASRRRLKASENLVELARVYSTIARGKDATVFTDVTGALMAASKPWRTIYGYGIDELIGTNPRVINSRLQPRRKFQEMWHALTDREVGTWSAELLNRRKNGELVRVWQTITTVRDSGGTIQGYLGQTRDMTEYEAVRDQLQRQNQRLTDLSRFKGEMIEVMAHDLKSPLQAVLGYADMSDYSLKTDKALEIRKHIEGIRRTGDSMLRLIQNFLELQRSEAGELQVQPQRCNLRALLRSVVESQNMAGTARTVTVRLDENGPALPMFIDPVRIEQALSNVVSNAIKYTARGTEVVVRITSKTGQSDRIHVEDCGPGIPEDQLESVFEAYHQAGGSKTQAGSVGWGLAIARKIIESHGGSIVAGNREAGGCRMSIELPYGYTLYSERIHSVVIYDPRESWAPAYLEWFQKRDIPCFMASDIPPFRDLCNQELPAVIITDAAAGVEIPQISAPDTREALEPIRVRAIPEGAGEVHFDIQSGASKLVEAWNRLSII